jgi:alanine dehydrogenase
VPAGAEALVSAGHEVFVEQGAGEGSGFAVESFQSVGARILPDADAVWKSTDMII